MRASLLAFIAIAAFAAPAQAAEFGIVPGGFTVEALDAEGNPEVRAGAHPDRFAIDLLLQVQDTGTSLRDLELDLPPGLSSYAGSVPECPRELFEQEGCPAESQVGVTTIAGGFDLPLFALEPGPGEAAAFGSAAGMQLAMEMELRPDNGVTFRASDLPQSPVGEFRIELWGVPADNQQGTAIPRRPFVTLPTQCGPVPVSVRVRSWQPDAPWLGGTAQTAPLTGCEQLRFEPEVGLRLTNPVADSPTGAHIDVGFPDDLDPDGQASAQVRNVSIRLPEGIAISPSSAMTLAVCADAQLGLGSQSEPSCPAPSKVGTIELVTPMLGSPLTGEVFLGEPRPGERFRTFLVTRGSGLLVKSAGAMQVDPGTGALSLDIRDLPQMPLSRLTLSLEGGARALLATPLECGPATGLARFDPYSGGAAVESVLSVPIAGLLPGTRCPGIGLFSPSVTLESASFRAGSRVELSTAVLRRDGEQLPRRFQITLPAGFNAALGATERCPEALVAATACPAASRIGGTVAAIGSGARPVILRGDTFLTGPYRGAPFGLLQVFPLAIGPFDLGTTAVRARVQLSPRSGRMTVLSEAMPAVVDGIPVRFRSMGLEMGGEGFVSAPTSCRPTSLEATIESMAGESILREVPVEVRGCRRLGFRPRIAMGLTGRSELHRGGNPGLRIVSRLRPGDSNLRAMRLRLPRALGFDVAAVPEICARRSALAGECPARSRVGRASARLPHLKRPLKGAMHVVQPRDDGLPDLWVAIEAMGVRVSLAGETAMRRGRLSIRLAGLADLPMSSFTMRTPHGERGVFSLRRRPCAGHRARRLRVPAVVKGQNGKRRRLRIPLRVSARCR